MGDKGLGSIAGIGLCGKTTNAHISSEPAQEKSSVLLRRQLGGFLWTPLIYLFSSPASGKPPAQTS